MAMEFRSGSNANDKVSFTRTFSSINTISYAAWVYPHILDDYRSVILTRYTDWLAAGLMTGGDSNYGKISCVHHSGSDELTDDHGLTMTLNQWNFVAGVVSSTAVKTFLATSRGATLQSHTITKSVTGLTLSTWNIGHDPFFLGVEAWDGGVAEAAIWDASLSDAEVLSLSKGFAANLVRPQSLKVYAPLVRDHQMRIGGYSSLSYGGDMPVLQTHPPILRTE